MDAPAEFDARIVGSDATLTGRDVALLRGIDEHGSINAAAGALDRSYSRAQRRVVALEASFGDLVERTRGGAGGGGSRLTDRARALLSRYDRLCAEFAGVVETAETVLAGEIRGRDGELATVATPAGTVRALVPPDDAGPVRVTVRADAITLTAPDGSPAPDRTSARNRLRGTVATVEERAAVAVVTVDVDAPTPLTAVVTAESAARLDLAPGVAVVASFKATATRGVPVDGRGEDGTGDGASAA
jgi:molybdate transport system regulatory protein